MLNKQSVKKTYSAHFKVHNVSLRYDYNSFTCFNTEKNTSVFSFCPVLQLGFSSCLFKASPLLWLVASHMSDPATATEQPG